MCVELTPFASSLEDGVTSRDPIVLRPGFLFLFRKKKRVPRTATLSLRQSCLNISEGLFLAEFAQAGGRWVTYSNLPHKHTRGCVLPSAQTMTAAPAGAVALSGGCRSSRNPPRRAHDAAGIPPPVLQVVSKCALREKKEEGPRFPGDLPAVFKRVLPAFAAGILPDYQALPSVLPAALFPAQRPPE